jgi:hypothetical protein
LHQEQSKVAKTGMIEEQHLVERKNRKMMGYKENVIPVKK